MRIKIKNTASRFDLEACGFTVRSNIENDLVLKRYLEQGVDRNTIEVFSSIIYYVDDSSYVDGKKPLIIVDPKDMLLHLPQEASDYEQYIFEVIYKLFKNNLVEAKNDEEEITDFMGLKTSAIIDVNKSIEEIYERYKSALDYFKKAINMDVYCPNIYMSNVTSESLDFIENLNINFETIKTLDQHKIFLLVSLKRDANKIYDKEALFEELLKQIEKNKFHEIENNIYEVTLSNTRIMFQYITINY